MSEQTAIVFYGFPFEENADDADDIDLDQMSTTWAKEHGPRIPQMSLDTNYRSAEWDEWRANKKVWENSPEYVADGIAGSEGHLKRFLHCPCFEMQESWEISPLTLRTDTQDAQRWLDAFCDRFGLPRGVAGWHLAALYF